MNETCALFNRCLSQPRGLDRPEDLRREDEWSRLVRATEGGLRSILRRLAPLGVPGLDADDVLQELYLRLWTSAEPLHDGGFWPYVVDVLRHLLVDQRRMARADKRRRRSQVMASPILNPEEQLLLREKIAVFLRSCRVGGAPARDVRARILELAYFAGYTSREIVRLVPACRSAGQVDAMVHRLRRRLARRGIELARRTPSAPTPRGGRRGGRRRVLRGGCGRASAAKSAHLLAEKALTPLFIDR